MRTIITLSICCSLAPSFAQRLVGIGEGITGIEASKLVVRDDRLVIGGRFTAFNGHPCMNIVAWDGANGFQDLPGAFDQSGDRVRDMIEVDGSLITVGRSHGGYSVQRWADGTWTQLGGTFNAMPTKVILFQDDLYVSGDFTTYNGVALTRIARWNGTAWTPVGGGVDDDVLALAVFGDHLYIGGRFLEEGVTGTALPYLARWDGQELEAVLPALDGQVRALTTYEGRLWAWGDFTGTIDGQPLDHLATFDGTSFTMVDQQGEAFLPPLLEMNFFDGGIYGLGLGSFDRSMFLGDKRIDVKGGIVSAAQFNGVHYVVGKQLDWRNVPGPVWPNKIGKLLPGEVFPLFEAHELEASFSPNGTILFHRSGTDAGLRLGTPEGMRSLVYSHGQFLVGFTEGTTRVSALDTWDGGHQYGSGPSHTTADASFYERYWRVRTIDRAMILDHIANAGTPGYVPNEEIMTWPAQGDIANGEPAQLAPFSDNDNDGIYSPEQGDAPLIRGDRMDWYTINDRAAETPFPELGMDALVTAYAYDQPAAELKKSLLLSYQFINRSSFTYDSVYVGIWTDFDIGEAGNDAAGCAPELGMYYGFNGTAVDGTPGSADGFGEHPPAVGMVALNAPLNSFLPIYIGTIAGAPPGLQEPTTVEEYEHLVHGLDLSGNAIIDPVTNTPTRFRYSGLPNDPGGFTMANGPNDPYYEVHTLASYGPFFHIAPGDTICFDLAYVAVRDMTRDNIGNAMLLRDRAQALHARYNATGPGCGEYIALGVDDGLSAGSGLFTLHPNPATDRVTLNGDLSPKANIALWSVTGQRVASADIERIGNAYLIDLGDLDAGMYVVHVQDGGRSMAQRLLKAATP